MAGPGVLLCFAPPLGTPLQCVCVHEHVCVCIYSSHGGLRSCEKEAVQDAILQKGREGRGAVRRRYPPLAACSWASPGHRTSLYHAPPGPLELYCPAVSHPLFALTFLSASCQLLAAYLPLSKLFFSRWRVFARWF